MKRADVEESSQLRAEMKQLHNEMNQMRVSHQQEIARLEAKQTEQTEEVKSLKAELKGIEFSKITMALLYFKFYCDLLIFTFW